MNEASFDDASSISHKLTVREEAIAVAGLDPAKGVVIKHEADLQELGDQVRQIYRVGAVLR